MLFWSSLCHLIPTQEAVFHLPYGNHNVVTGTEVSVIT